MKTKYLLLYFCLISTILTGFVQAQDNRLDTYNGKERNAPEYDINKKGAPYINENTGKDNSMLESLTPSEGFEGATFPPTGWTWGVIGGAATQRWIRTSSLTTGVGAYGLSFACANFNAFNAPVGTVQFLQTPTFPATVGGEVLRFDWHYLPYNSGTPVPRDSMIVQTSTDGGTTWENLLIMWSDTTSADYLNVQSMITGTRSTSSSATDVTWGTKVLSLPIGTNSIRFVGYSQFGNNIYLDNVETLVPGAPYSTGIYTINPGNPSSSTNWQSFKAAADSLNRRGISGNITINVTPGVYGPGNRFVLTPISGTSSSNRITFQKSGSGQVLIADTATASVNDFAILINGADWITFDGIDIRDASFSANGQLNRGYYMSPFRSLDGSKNITIKNSHIVLGGALSPGGASTGILGTGINGGTTFPGIQSGSCDSIKIQSVRINKSDRGIGFFVPLFTPTSTFAWHRDVEISNCIFGDSIAIGSRTSPNPIGIIPQGVKDANIFNNRIDSLGNFSTSSTIGVTGIGCQITTGKVYNNILRNLISANTTSVTPILTGIQAGPSNGENLYIYNNLLYNFVKGYTGAANATLIMVGINPTNFWSGANPSTINHIYNNTIVFQAPGNVTYSSAGINLFGAGLPVMMSNNCIINKIGTSSATAKSYGIGDPNTLRTFLNSNYNNIFVNGANGFTGAFGTGLATTSLTVADWKNGSTGDTNSVAGDVVFSSFVPLRVDSSVAANWVLNGKGIPISIINAGINGNPRNTSISQGTVDIGANEFNMTVSPPFATQSAVPSSGGTSIYTQFGDTLCIINWGTGGTYPTSMNVLNYSGQQPPNSGNKHVTKSYLNVTEAGGTLSGTTYDITYKYGFNQVYNISLPLSNLRLARQTGTVWNAYFTAGSGAGQSEVNELGRRVTVRGINGFSNFTLTDIVDGLYTQPLSPVQVYPANNATGIPTSLTFTWLKAGETPTDQMGVNNKSKDDNGRTIGNYWFELSTDGGFSISITDSTLTDTMKSLSGLNNSTDYWWRLRAKNENGWSSYSPWSKFTTTVAAPVAPTLSSPSNGATGVALTPLLDWNDVSGAASYRIQIATDAGFTNIVKDTAGVLSSQYQVLGGALNNNTQYFWKVNATNVGGTSAYSTAFSFTTIVAAPSAPTLQTPSNGATNISVTPTLDWSDVSGATTYRVQISTNSGFTAIIKDSAGLAASQFVVGSGVLGGNTTYYWRALATNAGGSSSFTSGFSFTTLPAAPSVPTLLTPANNSTGIALTPVLDWNDVSGATSYQIQISTNSGFTAIIKDTSGVLSSQYQVLGGLFSNNTQYYWRVNATNAGGTSSFTSAFNFTTIVAAPSTPTLLTPANGASGIALTPVLDWNDVSGAASYRIQISTNSGFTAIIKDTAGVLSSQYQVLGGLLSNNTQYYWRVNATNAGGTSSYTSGFSFTTIVSAPVAPTLSAPANNATGVSVTPLFDWSDVIDAINKEIGSGSLEGGPSTTYRIQISTNSGFTAIVKDTSGITASQYQITGGILNNSTQYYWRVNATNAGGTSSYSSVFNFTTLPLPPAQVQFTIIPGGLYNSSTGRLNMRDTVKVYLIDSSNCLKMDSAIGVVDSVTFGMTLNFSNAPTGKYYFYVMHRNHIVTASRLTQTVTRGSLVSYNFTMANNQAFGNNMIQVSSSPVRWGMIPGDGNRDGFVDGLDQTIWIIQNGLDGYFSGDFNGDGFVDGLDQTIWIVQNGQSYILPCIILDTPVNMKDMESFINNITPVLSPGFKKTK